MGVRDTSMEVYHKEVERHVGQNQLAVLNALQISKRPVCNQELSIYLKRPINQITPRVNELVKMGRAELAFKCVYPATNRRVCFWKASI